MTVTIDHDVDDLEARIVALIERALDKVLVERSRPLEGTSLPGGKLAVDEKEAASLLGLNPWQLRDIRRDGRIEHHRIVGGRVRYTAEHLRDYLAQGHEPPAARRHRKPQ